MRVETQRLLAEGMAKRPVDELAAFLSYADQRVRLRAQFELVARGPEGAAALLAIARKNERQLPRIHGIWGVGQLGRRDVSAVVPMVELLKDGDAEIRSQAAKVIGDAAYEPAADAVAGLLKDPSPRVRLFAGTALSKIGGPRHFDAIVAMLDANKVKETYLRTAGVVALVRACEKDASPLAALATHANRNVRLAAIVALRRLRSPLVERFLADKDEWVLAEAARAIHDDESVPQSLPALAAMLERPGLLNEPLLRRAINANLRVGDQPSARRLVAFATSGAPPMLRTDALRALAWFAQTPKLDRVEGRYRGLGDRDAKLAHAALDPGITRLLKDASHAVRNATVEAIQQLRFDAARDRLAQLAIDAGQPTTVRVPALGAIYTLASPQTREAVAVALKSDDARLRGAALGVMAKLDPENGGTLAALKAALAGESTPERQAALVALGGVKSKEATALLARWVDDLVAGRVPPSLQLDVIDSATAAKERTLTAKLKKYQSAKPKGDVLAAHAECVEGGDAAEGEAIFKSGQCTQCHLVGGLGGNVGPDLSHVASRLVRQELLESIVNPNAKIAEGFGTISVTTKDGDTTTGTVQNETPTQLTLKGDDGQVVVIKASEIESRTKPSSAMPPMAEVLKPGEIRHVVQYLSTLK
jgi:putative heme-binding domain-containing protein